jgi:hypothetical protein
LRPFQLFWSKGEQEFTEAASCRSLVFGVPEQQHTVVVWVFDSIDRLRIDPAESSSCTFRIEEITLLVP